MSSADPASAALEADWLGACRRATGRVRELLAAGPLGERTAATGTVGVGGDETLVMDRRAEDAIFAELESLAEAGHRFTALSEERGRVGFGSDGVVVVIDPIDGSLNAKRGIPAFSVSIAVAAGDTMADVAFGFVHDLGAEEEFTARRGEGAFLAGRRGSAVGSLPEGRRLDPAGNGRGLEVVAVEGAGPRRVARAAAALGGSVYRLRAAGSIAIAMCWLAAARVDGFVPLMGCRSVDVAAAQLIAVEAGALVRWGDVAPQQVPLDLESRSACVGARTEEGLEALLAVL